MKKAVIFASGNGSNAENLILYFKKRESLSFPFILSNNPNAGIHKKAQQLGVPSKTFTKEDLESGKVEMLLKKEEVDLLILAGFLLKIPTSLINAYPSKIINIHPSLLPKFGGKGMFGNRVHQSVIENGVCETGITIHYVNEYYDAGQIIFQKAIPVLKCDTPDSIAEKVHALEYEYFPKVIENLLLKIKN